MENKLIISSSPHVVTPITTQKIMLDVLIALLPAAVAGCIIFGLRALLVMVVCVAVSVLCEYLFNLSVKKEQTISDLSAAVTGLLLAFNLPATVPLWQAAVGSIFAIIIVKCIFGGIGCNIVNPAATARVFMIISFSSMAYSAFPVDTVASATPIVMLQNGQTPNLLNMFLGNIGGCLGETSKLALIIGGVYLLFKKVISWHIPTVFLATVFVLSFLLDGFSFINALYWVLSGGLVLGAIFMATDYVTSPDTAWGKVIFAAGAGVLTVLIRFYGIYPEGVSYAILIMNIINPYIEKFTRRKMFGGGKGA